MKFDRLFQLFIEAKNTVRTKTVDLFTTKVAVSASATEPAFTLTIKSMFNPNVKGTIGFDTKEDLDMMFKNLKSKTEVLNYIDYAVKHEYDTFRLAPLLHNEVSHIAKNMTDEEIDNLGLQFEVFRKTEDEFGDDSFGGEPESEPESEPELKQPEGE